MTKGMIDRRGLLAGTGAAAATGLLPATTHAQGAANFPQRAITLYCAFPAGGSADLLMRGMAEVAAKQLGQPVIIDNKAGGAGAAAAATMAATAKPDGYTLAQLPITVYRLPHMQKMSYDPLKDFTFVIHVTGYVLGVWSKSDGPFKSWADVVAYAKENPGKVTYASSGPGGTPHLGMEQIAARAGIKLTHVPMKGGTESSAALLGGHVMLQADSTTVKPLVDSGQFRTLMVWTAERAKIWPDVPTLKDLGYPLVYESPYGFAGPKGMDPAVVQKLHDAFKVALEHPSVQALLTKFDKLALYKSPADYTAFAAELSRQEKEAVEALGLGRKE